MKPTKKLCNFLAKTKLLKSLWRSLLSMRGTELPLADISSPDSPLLKQAVQNEITEFSPCDFFSMQFAPFSQRKHYVLQGVGVFGHFEFNRWRKRIINGSFDQ